MGNAGANCDGVLVSCKAMTYQYAECGLDRVTLVNGYSVHQTPHGEALSIEDVSGLHRVIAKVIVCNVALICGMELRFIRKHLDLSQKVFAELIGAEEQQVFRWKKAVRKTIPRMADRLVRTLFAQTETNSGLSGWSLKDMASLDAK